MKRLLCYVLAAFSFILVSGWEPERGYRGFVELNTDVAFYDGGSEWLYGLSTSHGYQIDSHFFVGAGVWWEFGRDKYGYTGASIPLYLQGRYDRTFGGVPLYADLRLGCTLFGKSMYNGEDSKIYISPTVGYRLALGRSTAMNFGLGLTLRGCDGFQHITFHPQPSLRIAFEF